MMPIEMKPRENTVILEINENELLEGYKETAMYHFMPEFFEKVYDGPNAEHLKSANKTLEVFKSRVNEYEYIGSHKSKDSSNEYYVEYYHNGNEIYVYLIQVPKKKYYPSLQMVCVFEKEVNANVS